MKIEKKKVTARINFSNAAKTTIAATFGLASVAAISGCNDDSDSIVGPAQGPTPASSSVNANVNESSSSVVDIPLSHEAISSSVFEELSSAATQPSKTSSSSYVSSGVSSASRPAPISSSAAEPTSSATEPTSSSNVENPASSSSSDTVVPPWPRECEKIDSMGVNVIMCNDYKDMPMVSMVSTYELFDNA
jgi:hypothetical protein